MRIKKWVGDIWFRYFGEITGFFCIAVVGIAVTVGALHVALCLWNIAVLPLMQGATATPVGTSEGYRVGGTAVTVATTEIACSMAATY